MLLFYEIQVGTTDLGLKYEAVVKGLDFVKAHVQ